MNEPRKPDQEVTLNYSPKGKSEWFKRGQQPDGWTLDDSAAKALAAKKEEEAKAARQKEIDDAVAAELAKGGIDDPMETAADPDPDEVDDISADRVESEFSEEGQPEAGSNLSEEEEKELEDLQNQIDELDKKEPAA